MYASRDGVEVHKHEKKNKGNIHLSQPNKLDQSNLGQRIYFMTFKGSFLIVDFCHDTKSTHTEASFSLISVNHSLKCILKVKKN